MCVCVCVCVGHAWECCHTKEFTSSVVMFNMYACGVHSHPKTVLKPKLTHMTLYCMNIIVSISNEYIVILHKAMNYYFENTFHVLSGLLVKAINHDYTWISYTYVHPHRSLSQIYTMP